MKLFDAAVVAAIALLAACKTSTMTSELDAASGVPPALVWSLQSFDLSGGQSVLVPDPERYTLELGGDGNVHVRADCNVCNGGYTLSGRSLEIGLLACTRAACPPDSLDDRYLKALSSTSSFQASGNELFVTYDDGVLRFRGQ